MGCVGLVNVTIPNSMLNISGGAFSNCNGITDVYYEGSEKQWNAITIDEYNECLTGATIHYKMEPHTHTAADPVCENEVEATCEGAGSYDEVVYCADCGEELSRETVTIPATDHDEGSDGYCVKCGQDLHPSERCKFCGKIHNGGFFDKLTGFFHKIFAIFKR